jgi:hypothetical protein
VVVSSVADIGWDALTVEVPSQQNTPVPRKEYVKSPCASLEGEIVLAEVPHIQSRFHPNKVLLLQGCYMKSSCAGLEQEIVLGRSPKVHSAIFSQGC